MADKKYWLWLTIAFGAANSRKWNAVSGYNGVVNAYESISSGDVSKVLPQDIKKVRAATMEQAESLIEYCGSKGISIASYDDEEFPQRLREIYNPPSVLFYLGDISGVDNNMVITAVGTRNPSKYSVSVSDRVCRELVNAGASIASGFALGLDSVAHTAAIAAKGKTYAVLSCGILYDYPPENADKKSLIAKHGAVISEYLPGEKPTSLNFRARNRILSGISLGTLVLQAGLTSGALSTASFALSQGRDIFCIPPHEIYSDDYAGAVRLLREGAIPVFDAEDIIREYSGLFPHSHKAEKPLTSPAEGEEKAPARKPRRASKKHDIPKVPEMPKAPKAPVMPGMSQLRRSEVDLAEEIPYFDQLSGTKKEIYEIIRSGGEVHLDSIAVGIGDTSELEAYLTELELDGLIRSLPGNRFSAVN